MTDPADALDDVIASVPWSRLAHAYDAALDAPMRLRALATEVANGTSQGLDEWEDWLLHSVVHQGTPYSATAPVLWIARRILGEGSRHPALGRCMLAVAESATALRLIVDRQDDRDGDEPEPERSAAGAPPWATYLPLDRELEMQRGDHVHDDYFLAARADVVTLTASVLDWEHTVADCLRDHRLLDEAIAAASAMLRLTLSPVLVDALRLFVDGPEENKRRAASAFALAASGAEPPDVEALIDHGDRVIRVAAALGCPDHPQALKSFIDAIADPNWVQESFPSGFEGPEPWLASALLTTVLDRVAVDAEHELLVDALEQQLATVAHGPLGATDEWGRVLAWLFPDRRRQRSYVDLPRYEDLSNTQCRLLAALVRNDDPWDQGSGNTSLALGQVGLPHDRSLVAALVGEESSRRRSWWRRRTPRAD